MKTGYTTGTCAAAALEPPLITQYFYLLNGNGKAQGRPIPLTLAEAVNWHAQEKKE